MSHGAKHEPASGLKFYNQQRFIAAQLAGTFSLIAVVLAAESPIYGLTRPTQLPCRTSEIGVRMALGADRLSCAIGPAEFIASSGYGGCKLGIPLAIGVGRLMAAQLLRDTQLGSACCFAGFRLRSGHQPSLCRHRQEAASTIPLTASPPISGSSWPKALQDAGLRHMALHESISLLSTRNSFVTSCNRRGPFQSNLRTI